MVTTQDDHMTVCSLSMIQPALWPDQAWCLSHVSSRLRLGGTHGRMDSTKAGDWPLWAECLKKSGLYYDEFVNNMRV